MLHEPKPAELLSHYAQSIEKKIEERVNRVAELKDSINDILKEITMLKESLGELNWAVELLNN